jgi:uncharacterized membrane protein
MGFTKIGLLYIITLVIFLAIDMLWLGVISKNFYRTQLGSLLREQFNLVPALLFYLLYIVGLLVFVIVPAVNNASFGQALGLGALFGLMAYATYDLSNLATLNNWPVVIVMADLAWGMTISAITSVVGYFIGHAIK